jgi:predicted GIY-YIG superfamily endonuclease
MNGIIYKIVCNITNDVYIGSTKNIIHRLYQHKTLNCSSCPIIERGNYTTIILEQFENINTVDLRKKEQEYISKLECINKNNAYLNQEQQEQYNKKYNYEYYHKHKDAKKEIKKIRDKEYYQQHKNKLLSKITCDCGGKYNLCGKARHIKTTKHQNYLKTINVNDA